MKVGILTINGYFNYGNRLQNYALEQAIKMIGFECETIINTTTRSIDCNINRSAFYIFCNKSFKNKVKMIKNKINKKEIQNAINRRKELCNEFSEKYINQTNFTISKQNIPDNICKKYEYFLAGSDQVWNPYDATVSEINFLTFVPKEKRITYAPSFGIYKIPNENINNYKTWLNNINKLSVREESGAKIIKELTGRDATVVLDPTMLLSKEQWLAISNVSSSKPKEKYLLTYFLGEIPKEVNKKIKKICKINNLKLVNLADINNIKYYVVGPSEFIDYINSATIFITDSFHGCVFSILLETPFIVCDRVGQSDTRKMSSRIDTLLKKFNLESRKFNNIKVESLFDNNYYEVYQKLDKEREKSWQYLKQALNK